MKGSPVPKIIKREIVAIYLNARDQGNDLAAKEVLKELKWRLERKEQLHLLSRLPKLRTVQLILTDSRKRLPEPQDVDGPWSLAASAHRDWRIPAEANADLLKIWRWCLVVGRKFTIREAQWASRLRGVVQFDWLLVNVENYAIREQVSEALGESLDTTDLDACLAFPFTERDSRWLHNTARDLGFIPKYDSISPKARVTLGKLDTAEWRSVLKSLMDLPASRIVENILESAFEHPQTLPDDADMVYALWLRRFSEGSEWEVLSNPERAAVAQRLFDEVKAVIETDAWRFPNGKPFWGFDWKPSQELLNQVGIEIEIPLKQQQDETQGGGAT